MKRLASVALLAWLLSAGARSANAQGGATAADGVRPISILGFDITKYPGDAAINAWRYPASPYKWIGFYLVAPCRRDTSWIGKRQTLASAGWGTAAIYVGQQDWSQHARAAGTRVSADTQTVPPAVPPPPGPCATQLLSSAQGTTEAADAVAQMRAEGFPERSTVFLDIELVTTVTPALLAYYQSWIAGVLKDGHYRPGIYSAKANTSILRDAATAAYRGASRTDSPSFWVASVAGFAPTMKPTDVGYDFAQLWQGQIGIAQLFNGVQLSVDVNVSSKVDPSAP